MLALALVLSIVGLGVGPALVALGRGRAVPSAVVEGLTLGLVPALLAVRLVPHVYEELGFLAVVLVVAGYLALWLADRWGHRTGARVGRAVIVPALALHAATDGAGLAVAVASAQSGGTNGAMGSAGLMLGAALLLHRLPEGLFLASTLVPDLGWKRTIQRLGVVAGATVLGALAGTALLARVPDALFDGAVAVGLGAMLRFVGHSHNPAPATRVARAASGLAFVLGVLVALALPDPNSVLARAQPRELSLVQSLVPLFVETAPSMLLGLLVAGLIAAFAPRRTSDFLRGGTHATQALRGMAFGLPLPLCSCGVLPMVRRLFVAGAPTAAVVAFALATPELAADSAVLSVRMLGVPLTVARLLAGALVALVVGVAVASVSPRLRVSLRVPSRPGESPGRFVRAAPRPGAPGAPGEAVVAHRHRPRGDGAGGSDRGGVGARLRAALGEAFGPMLDHVAAWYLVGLVIAASFEAAVQPNAAARIGGAPTDVLVAAVAAVPIYICAQGATPLAAVMIHKGFSLGAALTFALVAPGANLSVLAVLKRALGLRAAAVFATSVVLAALVAGLLVNHLVGPQTVPEIHPLVAHEHIRLEWAGAAVLAALLMASLLRLGPRAWFANLSAEGHDAGSRAHAPPTVPPAPPAPRRAPLAVHTPG